MTYEEKLARVARLKAIAPSEPSVGYTECGFSRALKLIGGALGRFRYKVARRLPGIESAETTADVARMCAEHDVKWWLERGYGIGKSGLAAIRDFVREHGYEIRGVDQALAPKVTQADVLDRTRRALALAVDILSAHEPGHCCAVSSEFVALAAVLTGDTSPEVMAIIDAPRDPASFNAVPTSLEVIVS